MSQFLINMLTAVAYSIGFTLPFLVAYVIHNAYKKQNEVKKSQTIWLEVFKSSLNDYIDNCKKNEDYREIVVIQNILKSDIEKHLDFLLSTYRLEYVEKIYFEESGEIINQSYYKIVKNRDTS